MQKRLISIFLVFILLFTFPLVSSADEFSWIDLFYEHMELNYEYISELLNSNGNHGPSKERLKSNSSHRDDFDLSDSYLNGYFYSKDFTNGSLKNGGRFDTSLVSNTKSIGSIISYPITVTGSCVFNYDIICNFTVSNFNVAIYDDSGSQALCRSFGSTPSGSYTYSYLTPNRHYYIRFAISCKSVISPSVFGSLHFYGSGFHFGWDDASSFHWESQITQSGNNVRTTIACILDDPDQRDSIDISGYSCSSGIVYHDPSGTINGYPSSDYFYFESATVNYPEPNVIFKQTFNFNLKDLENYRKRNRLDSLDNFYIFTQVMDSDYETVHYRQQLVNWSLVDDGIFSDVEDLPPYEPPDPSSSPTFPDISFDYNPTNNYYTYNTENIENYDFSQHGDDFSSFFQWFNGAFGTFNANFNGLIDAFNGNLKLFSDNMMDFTVELGDFIEGGFVNITSYLGALIDKVDVDFNNQINAFGDYFGNVMDIINRNVTVIIDNITANIELMFKPDDGYLDYVLLECCPWYYQVRDVISDVKDNMSDSDSVSVHIQIPPLDYDENVEFKDDETASLFRRTLSVILVAGTVLGCVRLGFQIFGINIRDSQGVD